MNNGFGDTLSTCASPVNRSDNVSSDNAEMTENRVEIEPEREVYRKRFGRAVKPVISAPCLNKDLHITCYEKETWIKFENCS